MTTETNSVGDLNVYGTQIVDYSIRGADGMCFSDVLSMAAIQQSYSIENLSMAYCDVVELRQQKVADLTEALGTIVASLGSIPTEGRTTESESCYCSTEEMQRAKDILAKYGFDLELTESGQATYGVLEPLRNDVQTEVDTENNDLERTMTSVEGLLNKRDNSFESASKIIDKNNTSAKTTIKAMGV